MTTFFLDLEGGNDSNDGTTFANRWLTLTSGATAARIAPGDIIKIMSQPDPTSLGNATWTKTIRNGSMPATKAISAVSNTTPIEVTTAIHGYSTGDIVQITGQTGNRYINGVWEIIVTSTTKFTLNTSLATGAGGTATGTSRLYNTRAIKLASACTLAIDMCEVAWTASANVTATLSTTNKQGDGASNLAIATAFTTGLVAYRALPASTDFSGYQQITFWINSNVALAAGGFQIKLCSDAAGVTAVDTFDVPAIPGTTVRFIPFTVNKGSSLGATIQSVALYAVTDVGAVTINLDSIVAVKSTASADSLAHTSLIGKDSASDTFYPIASIEGTCILLDGGVTWDCGDNFHMGYWGTEETVTTYKLDPIRLAMVSSGSTGLVCQDSGTAGNLITFSGGWDRVAMTTQARHTWVDIGNGLGNGWELGTSSRTFGRFLKLGCVRSLRGFYNGNAGGSNDWTLEDCHANGNADGFALNSQSILRLTFAGSCFGCANNSSGLTLGGTVQSSGHVFGTALKKFNCNGGSLFSGSGAGILLNCQSSLLDVIGECCGNCDAGIMFSSGCYNVEINEIQKCNAQHGTGAGSNGSGIRFSSCQDVIIHKLTEANDNQSAIILAGAATPNNVRIYEGNSSGNALTFFDGAGTIITGEVLINRWTAADTSNNGLGALNNTRFRVHRWGGVVDDHRTFTGGGEIRSETSVRHTASGVAYRLAPTSTNRDSAWPLRLPLGPISVNANALVTVKAWVRRTNTGLTVVLAQRKNQLTGISSDVTSTISAIADTWEELTIAFTPTEAGSVEPEIQVYGGSTFFGYVDDFSVAQDGGFPTQNQLLGLDFDWFGYPRTPTTGTIVSNAPLTFQLNI